MRGPGRSRSKRVVDKPYFCLPPQSTLLSGDASLLFGSLSRARQTARFTTLTRSKSNVAPNNVSIPLMQPSKRDEQWGYYIPTAPPLKQEPRQRAPLNPSPWVSNELSTNHPRSQLRYTAPLPIHTSVIHDQRIATLNTALFRHPSQPPSSIYPNRPRPQVAQPLFFPGTSNPSLWGLSGLAGIPNTGSGAGGWPSATTIFNAPLGGQPPVMPTTFSTCACPSCSAALQFPFVPVPPQRNDPRPNPSALVPLPPSRPQAQPCGVPAPPQAPSAFDDWEEEDLDPLEPRHQPAPTPSYSYQPPATVQHRGVTFTLSDFLGKGAAGRVVLGEHRGQFYAIKGIHKRCAQKHRHTRDDFLREKACMAVISASEGSRRFLMPLLMAWEEPEMIYFIMPFHPVDLYAALKLGLPTWNDRYLYCQELVYALCELRRLGIVHCDIKPSNILIAQDGRAVLADFGMAQLMPPSAYESWQRAACSGTYSYMAPEMVREDSTHGTVADVWSMGLVFLEILGISQGRHFRSVDIEGIRREHAAKLPFDSAVLPGLDRHHPLLAGLIISMLQADPGKRITAQRLQGEYVLSEAWSNLRMGYAAHDWKPHADTLPRLPAGRLLDFLSFRAYDDPVEAMRDRQQFVDTAQFEYCAPGTIFEFPEHFLGMMYRLRA